MYMYVYIHIYIYRRRRICGSFFVVVVAWRRGCQFLFLCVSCLPYLLCEPPSGRISLGYPGFDMDMVGYGGIWWDDMMGYDGI